VPPGSIYGATLQAITRQPTSEVLERLRLLDLSSISDDVAHEVFAKVKDQLTWEAENLRGNGPVCVLANIGVLKRKSSHFPTNTLI